MKKVVACQQTAHGKTRSHWRQHFRPWCCIVAFWSCNCFQGSQLCIMMGNGSSQLDFFENSCVPSCVASAAKKTSELTLVQKKHSVVVVPLPLWSSYIADYMSVKWQHLVNVSEHHTDRLNGECKACKIHHVIWILEHFCSVLGRTSAPQFAT